MKPRKFRNKNSNEVVEAIQFTGYNCGDIRSWIYNRNIKNFYVEHIGIYRDDEIYRAYPTDFVVKLIDGKFYVVPASEFLKQYEEITIGLETLVD